METARVETAAHDVGTGADTVIAQITARKLGLDLSNVTVLLGDSSLPPSPVSGGSVTTASVCNAVAMACDKIRDRLAAVGTGIDDAVLREGRLYTTGQESEELSEAFARLSIDEIDEYAEFVPRGSAPEAMRKLFAGRSAIVGGAIDLENVMISFGAEFVEVRIHARTKEIRVPRITGAFAAGRIVNPRTARSQFMGGMIWGISSALHEVAEIDVREGRTINYNLADYLVAVNADIKSVEVILVPETDTIINPLGIKGIGEVANVGTSAAIANAGTSAAIANAGTSAAIANAVYHATGKRIRKLPMRIESLLA